LKYYLSVVFQNLMCLLKTTFSSFLDATSFIYDLIPIVQFEIERRIHFDPLRTRLDSHAPPHIAMIMVREKAPLLERVAGSPKDKPLGWFSFFVCKEPFNQEEIGATL